MNLTFCIFNISFTANIFMYVFRSASFVDPGIAYWERKEKEEKRAVEEKEHEMSVPGTSQDSATEDEKRE